MRNVFISMMLVVFCANGYSQISDAETAQEVKKRAEAAAKLARDTVGWAVNGSFSVTASSIMLQNWQAGGADVLSGASIFNITPVYTAKNFNWVNNLVLAYGLNRQDGVTFKMDDRIDFQSNFNYQKEGWKSFFVSSLISFRTQFEEGFATPAKENRISTFMAPGYLVAGLGVTYKPSSRLIAYFSPITYKGTYVFDEELSNQAMFGLRNPGDRSLAEGGAYLNIFYREKLSEKINFQIRLDLFSNYTEEDAKPQNLDVNAEILFFWKLNKYLSFNAALNLLYDENILIPVEREDGTTRPGPRTQLKSVLGAGFAYTF
jgi:hypothetical protein